MSMTCPAIFSALNPQLCAAVDHYCERVGSALDAEPVNAATNAAFLIAAAGASYLFNRIPDAEPRGQLRVLIYLIAVVGLGSLTFHTIGTRWAEWADVIPIILYLTLYLWIAFTHFFVMPVLTRLLLIILIVGATFYAESEVPGDVLWGGALYLPIITALTVIGGVLLRQQPVAGGGVIAATAVFLVSVTTRSLDQPVCDGFSTGTHFLWHICNAIVLYILTTIAIVHVRIARDAKRSGDQ